MSAFAIRLSDFASILTMSQTKCKNFVEIYAKSLVAHKKLFCLQTRLEFKPNFLSLFMLAQIDNYYLPAQT